MRPPEELLYDSEASLRLVDHAIEELSSSGADLDDETRGLLEQQAYGLLRDVVSITEAATNDILSGVNRSLTAVERLAAAGDAERPQHLAALKEELNGMANTLQFQDITSQQLAHVVTLIADMRHRITQIVTIVSRPAASSSRDPEAVFDPGATATASHERQAIADEIVAIRADRKTA